MPQWSRYDALILFSVPKTGTDLRSLLASIDMVDHSLPTFREFNASVRRLRGSGLITGTTKEWCLTPDAIERMARVPVKSRGGMFSQVDGWLRFLETEPLTPDRGPNLRFTAYQKGIQAYHQWIAEILTLPARSRRRSSP